MFARTAHGHIRRLADRAVIPVDPRNPDYRDFLAWVAQQPGGVAPLEVQPTSQEIAASIEAHITATMDDERLISAVVWCIIETYSPPATPAKYQAARTKIVAAFKGRPWLP